MIKKFKAWRKHKQDVKNEALIRAELQQRWNAANEKRKWGPRLEQVRPVEDFMTDSDAKHYAKLATAHYYLCESLGRESGFFSPKSHPLRYKDNSPIATLTVQYDASEKHDIVPDFSVMQEDARRNWIERWTRDDEFEEAFLEWKRAKRNGPDNPWWDNPMGPQRDKAYAEWKASQSSDTD